MAYPPLVSVDATPEDQAADAIRAYCGWHIAPVVTETLTVDGSGEGAQFLPTMRIVSVASVTEDGLLLDPAGFTWSAAGFLSKGFHWLRQGWTCEPRGVVVTLTHGYDTCPAELAGVWQAMRTNVVGAYRGTSEQAGPFSVSGISELGQSGPFAIGSYEAGILDKYRIPNLG